MKTVVPLVGVFLSLVLLLIIPADADAYDVIELEQPVPDALVVRIPNSGFDFVTEVLEDLVNDIPINETILGMNPLLPEECFIAFSAEINITQSNIGDVNLVVSTQPVMGLPYIDDELYVMIELAKETGAGNIFEINVSGDIICLFPPYSATAEIDVTKLVLGLAISMDYNNPEPGLNIIMDHFAVNLVDFSFDIHNFPDEIESWFYGIIEDLIENLVLDLGQDLIQEIIDDELSGIVLEGDTPVGDYMMHFEMMPSLDTDLDGATFNSDMELYLAGTDLNPCVDPGWPIGSRYTISYLGPFGDTTPSGDPYHMAAALSDDILNQFLYSAYVKGIMCMGPGSLGFKGHEFVNMMGGEVPEEFKDKLDVDWVFNIYPASIPLIEVGDGDNDLAVIIDDMRIDWLTFEEGRYVELLNVEFDINIGLEVEMDETNNLIFTFNNPTINLTIHDSSFNNLPVEVIEPILDGVIQMFVDLLGGLIPPIPVPGISGWTLLIQELAPIGSTLDYLGIYMLIESPAKVNAWGRPDTRFVLHSGTNQWRGDTITLGPAQSAAYGLNDGRNVVVDLEAVGRGEGTTFHFSLDGTPWKRLQGNRLRLNYLIEGEHTLQVKAKNEKNREDVSPATLRFICDNVAPTVSQAGQQADRFVVTAWDFGDDNLTYRYQVDNGAWSDPTASNTLSLSAFAPGKHTVSVRVADRAGNVSTPVVRAITSPDLTSSAAPKAPTDGEDDGAGNDADANSGGSARNNADATTGGCHF